MKRQSRSDCFACVVASRHAGFGVGAGGWERCTGGNGYHRLLPVGLSGKSVHVLGGSPHDGLISKAVWLLWDGGPTPFFKCTSVRPVTDVTVVVKTLEAQRDELRTARARLDCTISWNNVTLT